MDGTYYIVGEESPAMAVIRQFEQKQREFNDAVEAFRVKYGATQAFTYGVRGFAGLKFSGEPPKGWRERKDGICTPDTRSKIGKLIKDEVRNLPPGFDAWTFSSSLGDGAIYFGEGKAYFSGVAKYGEQYVLRIPAASRFIPAGCTELKMSEYWKIREDAGEAREPAEALTCR
jgi:hypothetical protein